MLRLLCPSFPWHQVPRLEFCQRSSAIAGKRELAGSHNLSKTIIPEFPKPLPILIRAIDMVVCCPFPTAPLASVVVARPPPFVYIVLAVHFCPLCDAFLIPAYSTLGKLPSSSLSEFRRRCASRRRFPTLSAVPSDGDSVTDSCVGIRTTGNDDHGRVTKLDNALSGDTIPSSYSLSPLLRCFGLPILGRSNPSKSLSGINQRRGLTW